MKKSLLFALMICLLVFSAGNATLTKALTMGDANGIIHDDANIWLYPSTFYSYPDMAIGEFSSGDFDHIGLHYKFKDDNPIMVGLYFTTNQPFSLPHIPFGWDYWPENNNRIDLFVSSKIGENPMGLHLNYISNSRKYEYDSVLNTSSPNSTEEGISNIAIDLGITMMEGKADLAAGINFLSFTDINNKGNDQHKPTGNFAFYVLGRYFYEMNQKSTLVPHIKFESDKVGYEFYDNANSNDASIVGVMTQKYEYSDLTIDVGCGLNYSPAAGINAIGDIGVMMITNKLNWLQSPYVTGAGDTLSLDQEYKDGFTTLPYFKIGLDAAIFDWLDLRLGGTSYWTSRVDEDKRVGVDVTTTPDETFNYTHKLTRKYVTNSTYLGAGFHWGNFKIDAYVDPEIFTNGLYFISGDSFTMNYQVSVLYEMF